MRAQLAELGYTPAEVAALDAERAAAIIQRNIGRPSKGVPSTWKRGASGKASPVRSAVNAGRSLLLAVGKPLKAVGVPSPYAGPATLFAVALSALGFLMNGRGDGAAVVKAALAPIVDPMETEEMEEELPYNPDDLWLDRQIDKLIAMLKRALGK